MKHYLNVHEHRHNPHNFQRLWNFFQEDNRKALLKKSISLIFAPSRRNAVNL